MFRCPLKMLLQKLMSFCQILRMSQSLPCLDTDRL